MKIAEAKLTQLKEFAEKNPITLSELQQIIAGDVLAVGDRQGYTVFIDGFKLVFSIEEHPASDGSTTWGRHMSVSGPGKIPNVEQVQVFSKALGFKALEQCYMRYVTEGRPAYVEVFCEM